MTNQRTPEQIESDSERIADLVDVMSSPAGRRFVWRLLGECGTFQLGWTPSAEIHLHAGKRLIGLNLFGDVHAHCFEQYQEMEREAREADRLRKEQPTTHNDEVE